MNKLTFTLVLVAPIAMGCASTQPPRELVDARAAHTNAVQSRGANLAAADMHEADKALETAEKAFDDDGDDQRSRDLAYVAQRKAIAAQAKGDTMIVLQQKAVAENELKAFREQQAQYAQRELGKTKQQLDSERAARMQADEKTRDALAKIQGLQSKQDERGLVLTLSGSVLFATGKSALLPEAQKRLTEVAEALKAEKRPITIVGHTDSTGSAEVNRKLSQDRADAVRKFLGTRGVDDSMIRTEGAGPDQPVADNTTAEGRANNRRVEIILQPNGNEGGNQNQGAPNQGVQNNTPGSRPLGSPAPDAMPKR